MKAIDDSTRAAIETDLRAGQLSQSAIAASRDVSRSTVSKIAKTIDVAPGERAMSGTRVAARVSRGRQTSVGSFASAALKYTLPPDSERSAWTTYELSADKWKRMSFNETVRLLIDIDPGFSRAVWDVVQMFDPGHEIVAYRPGTDTPYPQAQAKLDEFLAVIRQRHGGMKVQTARIAMSLLMRGAFGLELVLDKTGRRPIDLVVPDPAIFRFEQDHDDELGSIWKLGQLVSGKWVSLEYPTIKYFGLHAAPDSPYGRSMLAPAVFPAIFLLGLMHDLRRVIAQQGYPRTTIILKMQELRDQYKELSADEFERKVSELADLVAAEHALLEPDDAFVFGDTVDVKHAAGAIDSGVVRGSEGLITALERMAIRALKTIPLLMAVTDSVSEANANRQWEMFAASIASMQQPAETALGDLLALSLQVQGIVAKVVVKFAKIRAAEAQRDALTKQIEINNAIALENAGYVDADEAAMLAIGHKATGTRRETEPPPPIETGNPEPGADRSRRRPGARAPWFGGVSPVRDVDEIIDESVDEWRETFAGTQYEQLLDARVEQQDDER